MFSKIFSILTSLLPSMRFLPDSWAVSIYFKIIKIMIWYETKWLKYYIQMLLQTKDYYSTLDDLNHNKFCPEDLAQNFINYARAHYSDLVHA